MGYEVTWEDSKPTEKKIETIKNYNKQKRYNLCNKSHCLSSVRTKISKRRKLMKFPSHILEIKSVHKILGSTWAVPNRMFNLKNSNI